MSQELLPLSVGLGLVVNLCMTELFGVAAGGFVVPGYIALSLHQPFRIIATVFVAICTCGIMHALSRFIILYGRRRVTFCILIGYLCASFFSYAVQQPYIQSFFELQAYDSIFRVDAIGFVIPGLLALSFERQGIYDTLCTLCISSVLVHLILSYRVLDRVVL